MIEFYLDRFLVQPSLDRISCDGQTTKLPPKQMALLCRLAQQPGQPVGRQQLLEEVWDRDMVNDEVLSRNIAELRAVLGDSARQPRFIETISKKGYRLLVVPQALNKSRGSVRSLYYAGAGLVLALLALWVWGSRDADLPPTDQPNVPAMDVALNARQLTSMPEREFDAVFSADGRQLGFSSLGSSSRMAFWIGETESASFQQVPLGDEVISRADLSPDTERIAMISHDGQQCEVRLLNRGNGQVSRLADCWPHWQNRVEFSPDSQRVVFSYADQQGAGLSVVDLESGVVRVLTKPAQPAQYDVMPRFSNGGNWVLFARGNDITRELYIVDANGGKPRQLTDDNQLTEGHDWLDDQHIIFSSDRLARRALWQLKVDTGEIKLVGASGAYSPTYHSATSLLVYEQPRFRADVYRVDLTTPDASMLPLLISSRYDNHPMISSDGKQIAFITNRTGLSALWLASWDGTEQRLLFEQEGARVSRPSWRRDGQALIATIYQQDGNYLLEYDLEAGQVRHLRQAGNAASAGVYGPDGRSIFYLDGRQGTTVIWRLKGGVAEQYSELSANRLQIGENGDVYFSRPEMDGIWRLTESSVGQATLVEDRLVAGDWNHWSLAANALYFRTTEGVMRRDLGSAETRLVSKHRPTSIGISISVSPDERWMTLSRTETAESDLMGVEYPGPF